MKGTLHRESDILFTAISMANLTNDNIIHTIKGSIQYIRFRKLLGFPEVIHCFTLKPLDFMSSHEESARSARLWAAKEFEIAPECLCKPHQTHSDHIRIVHQEDAGILPAQLEDTDGLITDQPGLALLLTFADCTPLLFYDPVRKVIADIHSGWRGTLARIGAKAVSRMADAYGCNPADIICCIGPHIHKCCFEVDEDVADLFRNEFSDLAILKDVISYNSSRNKYYIDTLTINTELLKNAGLLPENIIDSCICTVCHFDVCQSYRADKSESGRSASIILLR